MSNDDDQPRLGLVREDGFNEEDRLVKVVKDDSPLIFEFLKRKRPMPSARRLDYML